MRLTSPEECSEVWFEKSSFLFIIFALSAKNLTSFWRKILERIVKTAFFAYRAKISMIFFSEKNLFFKIGLFLQELFHVFAEIFWQACQKCNLGVQGNILRENNFFSFSSEQNPTFGRKILPGLSNVHSTCQGERSEELFCGEKIQFFLVSRFWAKNFWTFGDNFRQACQNSFLRLQWSVLIEEKFIGKNKFLSIFVHWPDKISAS